MLWTFITRSISEVKLTCEAEPDHKYPVLDHSYTKKGNMLIKNTNPKRYFWDRIRLYNMDVFMCKFEIMCMQYDA